MTSFLDNSGDIILDAVLTDVGRQRLAAADGSFNITKFAFGDDEINYGQFISTGSQANQDIDILKTPVFEAFTNTAGSLNSRLLTLTVNPFTLYLPVARINNKTKPMGFPYAAGSDNNDDSNMYVVLSSQATVDKYVKTKSGALADKTIPTGFINGVDPQQAANYLMMVDEGIDNTAIPFTMGLPQSLTEDMYLLEMDDRLGALVTPSGAPAPVSFIDTNNIAQYQLSAADGFFDVIGTLEEDSILPGARGVRCKFSIYAQPSVQASDYLFTQMGQTTDNIIPAQNNSGSTTASYIDTTIRLIGVKTGVRLDQTIRFLRV